MASSKVVPRDCTICGYHLHPVDKHSRCWQCLGAMHPVSDCADCKLLSKSAQYKRRKAQGFYLREGRWPASLEMVSQGASRESEESFKTCKNVPTPMAVVLDAKEQRQTAASKQEGKHTVEEAYEEEGASPWDDPPPPAEGPNLPDHPAGGFDLENTDHAYQENDDDEGEGEQGGCLILEKEQDQSRTHQAEGGVDSEADMFRHSDSSLSTRGI